MPKKEFGYLSVRIEEPLRERVARLAQQERRRLGVQACILIEYGLSVIEGDTLVEPPSRHDHSRPLIDSLEVLP